MTAVMKISYLDVRPNRLLIVLRRTYSSPALNNLSITDSLLVIQRSARSDKFESKNMP